MSQLKCKRIYVAPETTDGFRILVDRLWPRGVRKDGAQINLWAKEVAPSTELRKWFGHAPERFAEFSTLYTAELDAASAAAEFLDTVRNELKRSNVTLIYGARDAVCNHAEVLKAWIAHHAS